MKPLHRLLVTASLLSLSSAATPAWALNPTVQKVQARNTATQLLPEFGRAVAISEKYYLIGEPENDDRAANAGAVHVFQAGTGRYLRKLTASDAGAGAFFGSAVSVAGDRALIGAPGAAAVDGRAYLFDLRRGVEVAILSASDQAPGGGFTFGESVALNPKYAVVGAPGADAVRGALYVYDQATLTERKLTVTGASDGDQVGDSLALEGDWAVTGGTGAEGGKGAVWLFDLPSGRDIRRFTASDGAVNDQFGRSVTLGGDFIVVGAHRHNPGGSPTAGAAYLYQISANIEDFKFTHPGATGGEEFGRAVAIQENTLLIGAPNADRHGTDSGVVWLYDFDRLEPIDEILPGDGRAFQRFGRSLALCGNRALIGAPRDDTTGSEIGAAYTFDPLLTPLPARKVAALGDFAPGVNDAQLGAQISSAVSPDGAVSVLSTLFGPGAPRGRNVGWFHSGFGDGSLKKSVVIGDDIGSGLRPAVLTAPIYNRNLTSDFGPIMKVVLGGFGVSRLTNSGILRERSLTAYTTQVDVMLRTGDTPAAIGGGVVGRILEPTQNDSGTVVVPVTLVPGIAGVVPTTDSGIFLTNALSGDAFLQEGDPSAAGVDYGQFARAKADSATSPFTAALQSGPTDNQGLFVWNHNTFTDRLVARKGGAAPGLGGGELMAALFGETNSGNGDVAWRATLSGPGVGRANNEALLWEMLGEHLVARKGAQLPSLPAGVVFSRFLQFWRGDTLGPVTYVLFLAKLAGPGIHAGNDCGLFLRSSVPGSTASLLLREGDPAPGCDSAVIGTIQRVVTANFGRYAVLASLAGSTRATNQALFYGHLQPGPDVHTWKPTLLLRKGTLYRSRASVSTAILSLDLPAAGVDLAGAGGCGQAQSLSFSGNLLVRTMFTNRAVELIRLDP